MFEHVNYGGKIIEKNVKMFSNISVGWVGFPIGGAWYFFQLINGSSPLNPVSLKAAPFTVQHSTVYK